MDAKNTTTTPTRSATAAACPFGERFGRRLPRGFADEAAGLDWRTLIDTYAPSTDRFHLADLSRRPLGRGITAYEAILATRGTRDEPGRFTARRLTTESCGDLTAMSEMLGRVGARVEIERFHQYEGHRLGGSGYAGHRFEVSGYEGHRLEGIGSEGGGFGGTESWCTILRTTCGRRQTWALGFGESSPDASIAALLSAATLLHLR